jgi:transposase-like protein
LGESSYAHALKALRRIINDELSGCCRGEDGVGRQSGSARPCPRCGSEQHVRRGRDSRGRQRFRCKRCGSSFTAQSGSAFSSTNLPRETWLTFATCHLDASSLRESARRCHVSLKTAFHMRHRLNRALGDAMAGGYRNDPVLTPGGGAQAPSGSRRALQPSIAISVSRMNCAEPEYAVCGVNHLTRASAVEAIADRLVRQAIPTLCEAGRNPEASASPPSTFERNADAPSPPPPAFGRNPAPPLPTFSRFARRFRGISSGRTPSYLRWYAFVLAEAIREKAERFSHLALAKMEQMTPHGRTLLYRLPTQPFASCWLSG